VDSIGLAMAQEFSLLPAENTSGDPAAAPDLDGRRGDAARGAGGTLEMSAVVVARPMRLKKQENLG
jgi:hypothetical protein